MACQKPPQAQQEDVRLQIRGTDRWEELPLSEVGLSMERAAYTVHCSYQLRPTTCTYLNPLDLGKVVN